MTLIILVIAALEVLVSNYAVANLIREGKVHQIANAMVSGVAQGNQFLNVELAKLVKDGIIDAEEALNKAFDKADLARRIGIQPSGMKRSRYSSAGAIFFSHANSDVHSTSALENTNPMSLKNTLSDRFKGKASPP